MYVNILNYRKGEVLIVKYSEETPVEDFEEWVTEHLGHSDFHYMCTNELILKINPDED